MIRGNNYNISDSDIEYMSSLSSAVLQKSTISSKIILWFIFITFLWFIVWASFAEVDEMTRGEGKVIPSGQVQVIQNLEGGIIADILVKEGDKVKKGDILLKVDNKKFVSSFEESKIKLNELKAKARRLYAEANNKPFLITNEKNAEYKKLLKHEESLYLSNKNQLNKKISIIDEQLLQKRNQLKEAQSKIKLLGENYKLIQKEIIMSIPLVKKHIMPEVELLKIKREAGKSKQEIESLILTIPRLKSEIQEVKNKKAETILDFQNKAKKEWNETMAEIARVEKTQTALEDQVKRTLVRSPVTGTVKQVFINTIGGVIKPGMDLMEIVPTEDSLVIETKIKPSDIAFLHPDQKATIKFTAYDFSIYGGLEGKVVQISADTITDKKGNSFYLVKIKTNKNYLEKNHKKLEIIPGMVANVDILTGKKTIMKYLLKPIFKAKNNALRER